ncbi:MAG: hypothetical protein K9L30_12160 [Desulfobacterales bacterium]|nr:hypothetical protein [Desulfobacterales bacterium]
MIPTPIDEGRIKQLFKEALMEALEERRGVFQDLITEAVEDIAMVHAIQKGKTSGTASKKDIFNILEGHS